MRSTLVAMGFGPSFFAWVDLFYHRVQSCVNVNGYVSAFFNLSRVVRQGCPLSPLLYVLVSEVLAAKIRCNTRISGLPIAGFPPLSPISQYADDTSLIVSSDDAMKAVFETYALFERASGSKLNQAKSKGLWLGGWCGRSDPPVALEWSSSKIKVLGVFIGAGDLDVDNWRPPMEAVDHVLKSWRSRYLSFRGKALVINALALSRVWYVACTGVVLCCMALIWAKLNRWQIASLRENVGGVAPPTTRRTCVSGRGVSLLHQWRFLPLRWRLTPLSLLCRLSLIVRPFQLREKMLL